MLQNNIDIQKLKGNYTTIFSQDGFRDDILETFEAHTETVPGTGTTISWPGDSTDVPEDSLVWVYKADTYRVKAVSQAFATTILEVTDLYGGAVELETRDNVYITISRFNRHIKSAYDELQMDILNGVKDVATSVDIAGLYQRTGDVTKDWIEEIPSDSIIFDQALTSLALYKIIRDNGLQGGEEYLTYLALHRAQYLSDLSKGLETYATYLEQLTSTTLTDPGDVRHIRMVRV